MDILIYGCSDDIIEIEAMDEYGNELPFNGANEYDAYSGSNDPEINAEFVLTNPDGEGVRIYAIYNGMWAFAVVNIDYNTPIPNSWKIVHQRVFEHEHSVRIRIKGVEPFSAIALVKK